MNLEAEILKEHSKRQSVKIGKWIGNDRTRFKQLIELFLRGEYRITQRSAWIVSYCGEKHPELITPWLARILEKMQEPGVHVAVKRNVLRILQDIDIPRSLLGIVTKLCFDYLSYTDSPIAVKVFAMTVLANVAKQEPGITRELRATIELMLPYAGPGIRSRGRKVLKQLGRM